MNEVEKYILTKVAGLLVVIWLIAVLFGKGGFIHILLLSAVAFFVVEWIARRRAAM